MRPVFSRKSGRAACTASILLIVTISAIFLAGIIYFPNAINLTEKNAHILKFGLPFTATIEPETVNTLRVNSAPVTDNINVNLARPLTIESDESGTATMTLRAFGFPLKKIKLDIMPGIEVVPCGMTVGVEIETTGVMVLGTGSVGGSQSPSEGKLISGDLILSANGDVLNNKDDLKKIIANSKGEINLKVERDNELLDTKISGVKSSDDGKNKLGVWVRDSTKGIGTVTFYNPQDNVFGALGHGILDVDTKKLMKVKRGSITHANISSIKKGAKGSPGELTGEIKESEVFGRITVNTPYGIYGYMETPGIMEMKSEKLPIGMQDQIHEGPAVIYSDVDNSVKKYDVFIESVNRYSNDETKGMVLRITDPALLRKTNGIVQGMSGSPIIQDEKVIGAVTHVFVQDPAKGYGIFIENMMKAAKDVK